jgi:hypothetical protein
MQLLPSQYGLGSRKSISRGVSRFLVLLGSV